jgi:hypothetical protein
MQGRFSHGPAAELLANVLSVRDKLAIEFM